MQNNRIEWSHFNIWEFFAFLLFNKKVIEKENSFLNIITGKKAVFERSILNIITRKERHSFAAFQTI